MGEVAERLEGPRTVLVRLAPEHAEPLRAIRAQPEVARWWHDDEAFPLHDEPDAIRYTVLCRDPAASDGVDPRPRGMVQFAEEDTPEYRHAGIDIFLDPALHGRGFGREVVGVVAAYLVDVLGHHRLTIDPAATNAQAIACYTAVGFRPVGVMREYELGPDGTFHDGLLMDLLAAELRRPA
jgi:aminoglycoside 6'-N-acetyltransferase